MKKFIRTAVVSIFLSLSFLFMFQAETQAAERNGVAKGEDGNWYYYVEDTVIPYQGLAKYNGSWWYFEDGKLDFGYTGLCKYNGSFWYVKNGQVDFASATLCKHNGSWWYVSGGKVNFGATGLCKYNGSWWYIKNGQVNFSATTLCKFNGSWWYVKGGKVDFSATTLCKYNGAFWYVKGGKVDFSARTLCKYNGSFWYVTGGKVAFGAETLCKYNGSWWYVCNGKVDFGYTGYTKYNGSYWYIKGGKMVRQAGYTGMAKSNNTWVYYEDGKINTKYTGMAQNAYGWWYFQNGKINFSYHGMAQNQKGWWYFKNGKLDFSFTGVMQNGSKDGLNYYWYFENGKINFDTNKRISYSGATFDVENGRAYVVGKNKAGYYNTVYQSPYTTRDVEGYASVYERAYRSGNTAGFTEKQKKVLAGLSSFIEYAENYRTLFEKELAIHDYMVLNGEYHEKALEEAEMGNTYAYGRDPYSYEGMFINKMTVCQGYAEAFQMSMNVLGIPCLFVSGTTSGGGHAWNAVQLEGEWYQVDVTWDDPIPDEKGRLIHDYFNITDEQMRKDHSYTSEVKCNGTKYGQDYLNYLKWQELKKKDNYFTNAEDAYTYAQQQLDKKVELIELYVAGDIPKLSYEELEGWSRISYKSESNNYYSYYWWKVLIWD